MPYNLHCKHFSIRIQAADKCTTSFYDDYKSRVEILECNFVSDSELTETTSFFTGSGDTSVDKKDMSWRIEFAVSCVKNFFS
jgi:hypothetical protein